MNRKARKNILISLLLIIVVAASFGYYMFSKGPRDVKHSTAIEINATALYDEFSKDSTTALKKYADKILLVNGEITSISLNQKKEQIILLKTGVDEASINCTLEEEAGNIKVNDKINIKGICSGIGQGDADLGIQADVYLTRCFLIK